jgi:hypothetical protein
MPKETRKVVTPAELPVVNNFAKLDLQTSRIVSPRRDRPVNFALPSMSSAGDASKALATIMAAVASGELTPVEAAELSRVIEGYVKTLEATEIERRLRFLEERAIRDAR